MASLRDLGLSEYEARAYRSLLNTGPTTAKELSRASDVPMGRIYDVLNSLEQYNLVRSQTASRPKKYVGVEPATALDRLLDDKRRELEAQARQYEEIVETLESELETAEPIEDQFWTAAVGGEEAVDLLLERLAAADRTITMVATDYPFPQLDVGTIGDRVADELESALERGVTVQLLMSRSLVDALSRDVGRRYRQRLQPHEDFRVRTSDDVRGTFHVIDDVEVCIHVPNPLVSGDLFALIDLKDREFATGVYDQFEPRWENATPLTL